MTPEQTKALRTFARTVIGELVWEGGEGGEVVQDLAINHGLIERVPGGYDPKEHGPHDYAEPGDTFYVFADWLKGDRG